MHIDANLVVLYVFSVVVMIAMPGPVAVFVAGTGIVGGPKLALRAIAGTNAGSLVLIVLSMLVVQGLLSINETVFTLLKGGGALYIGYLGYQMLHDAGRAAAATPVATHGSFTKGFVMSISNPKDIIFFASFFPQFLEITPQPTVSLGLLTGLWIVLDFATLMTVCLLVRRLVKPNVHRGMLRVSGVLLMLIALLGVGMAGRDLVSAGLPATMALQEPSTAL
ncbi:MULTISPECIES: LysE family translocator [Stenotrophomonas]|jgi:threonine/homoserine/homoserine lactone efflux protein|uniref:LysE family translocator n=1 Tax=Stenotrophomonas bentonitica TaxID=1450134 RepID=A0ABU9JN29_9GAMM|nr:MULTISPECIES: LysE family translocator [Stenotrophomonas]